MFCFRDSLPVASYVSSGHITGNLRSAQIEFRNQPFAMLALDQLVCFLLRLESIFRQLQRFPLCCQSQIAVGNR